MNHQSPNRITMEHSILLSKDQQVQIQVEQKTEEKTKRTEFVYPSWINESTLLSLSIISFCTLLSLLGCPLWITIPMALLFLGLQVRKYLSSFNAMELELDKDDVLEAITKDLYTKN